MTIFLVAPESSEVPVVVASAVALSAAPSLAVEFGFALADEAKPVSAYARLKSIPHFGHLPRFVDLTSGCIGQK
jgi:hypothetical protein